MKLYIYTLSCFLFLIPCSSRAQDSIQQDINFAVGDTLIFGNTDSSFYPHIDYYVKTRIEPGNRTYNHETGDGFYQYFFSSGDFDASRLPASFKGKSCVIVAFQDVKGDDGIERTIVLARLESERHIAWIEMQSALESGEIRKKSK